MGGFEGRRKKHQSILCLAFLIAIGAHVLAIYWLKDMKIDFYSMGQALMESHSKDLSSVDARPKTVEDVNKRNQQLAEAFRELVKKPAEPQDNTRILPEIDIEFLGMRLEDEANEPSAEKILDLAHEDTEQTIEHWDSLDKAATNLEPPKEEKKLFEQISPSLITLETLKPHEDNVADELIKATEAVQGVVTVEVVENLSTDPGIKVGALETSAILGNSIDMQPGFLDVGREDSLARMPPPIIESSDTGQYKEDVTHFLSRKANLHLDETPTLSDKDRKEVLAFAQKEPSPGSATTESTVLASSEHFTLNIQYAKRQRGQGYLFRLELVPKPNVSFRPISQNYYFLIDRSNSIGQQRYEITKAAVNKALKLLRKGDTFNIIVFDNNITKLSETNLPWGLVNYLKAQEFLKNQKAGGLFATTDLYTSLNSIVPNEVAENEVNTAILLSDGDTFLSAEQQRNTIGQWTQQNAGKVSLFCVGIKQGDNLALMDLLSSFNKGGLRYAETLEFFDATLLNLMQSLQNPIGKSITASAIVKDPTVKVALLPSIHRMPNLYQDSPYVIYGRINHLKDFHIFFQGRYFDKWLDIKQTVSFKNAEDISNTELEYIWSLQSAYDGYEQYLHDKDISHLNRAKKLLAPYHITLPFQ